MMNIRNIRIEVAQCASKYSVSLVDLVWRAKISGKTLAQMNYSRCRITVKFYGLDDVNNILLTLSATLKTRIHC